MTEEYKSLAYTIKDMQNHERQVYTKILRVLRNQEKRLERVEKHLKIVPSPYELEKENLGLD